MYFIETYKEWYLFTENLEDDSYYFYKVSGNVGMIKMRYSALYCLKDAAWYVQEALDNHIKATKTELPEEYNGIFYSDCLDDAGIAFLARNNSKEELERLNEFLKQYDNVCDAMEFPHAFQFT